MKASMIATTLTLALLLAGCGEGGNASGTASTAAPTAIPAPNGGDWTQTVVETADGGFLMGNPAAPVQVVEFASMTCGGCASFSENGAPPLVENYVKTGQVSFEIRNFVRDPADLAAALLARCGGATPFYTLTDQLFAAQEEWIGKLQTMTPAEQQRLQTLQPQQAVGAMAEQAGLVDFVRLRGIPTERAQACLADEAALQKLVNMANAAQTQHQITGTPMFLVNGELAETAADWGSLEPMIQAALN